MLRIFASLSLSTLAVVFSTAAQAEVRQQVRVSIDRIYAPEQQEDGRPVARLIIYEPVEHAPGKR